MASKIHSDAAAALDSLLFDGMTIAAGGFGLCGIPETLIAVTFPTFPRDTSNVRRCHNLTFESGVFLPF